MSGGDGPCGLTRRRILRRRNPEPATSSTGHRRGVGCFVFAFGAITLGRRVYACWGLENRKAALRMITGSAGSGDWGEPRGQVLGPDGESLSAAGRIAGCWGADARAGRCGSGRAAAGRAGQTRHSAATDHLASVHRCTRCRPGAARRAWASASRLGARLTRVGRCSCSEWRASRGRPLPARGSPGTSASP